MRERIQSAAATLFTTRGYDGTSISAIASEVGVSAGALYHHFESKEDLVFSIMRDGMIEYGKVLDAEMAGKVGPVERVRSYAIGHVKAMLCHPAAQQSSFFSERQLWALSPGYAEAVREMNRPYFRMLRGLLREGNESGVFHVVDVTSSTFAIVHMCEYVRVWFRPEGPIGVDEIAEEHGEYALRIAGYRPAE